MPTTQTLIELLVAGSYVLIDFTGKMEYQPGEALPTQLSGERRGITCVVVGISLGMMQCAGTRIYLTEVFVKPCS